MLFIIQGRKTALPSQIIPGFTRVSYGLGAICPIGRSYVGAMVLQCHKADLHAVLVWREHLSQWDRRMARELLHALVES